MSFHGSGAVGASGRIPWPLLAALALLTMTGPLATDLYLPAFPRIAEDLGVGASAVQLTLTAFLLGMGAGQLLFGALSDRYGRLRPLLFGCSVFVAASVGVAVSPSVEMLTAFRLLQGMGGAAGVVLARAIIADRVSGPPAARLFSILMTISAVAPAVAPLAGSLVLLASDWRGVLWVLAGAAALMLLGTLWQIRETLQPERRRKGSLFGGLAAAVRHRRFVGYVVLFASAFGVMMAYISGSPFLYQEIIGVTPTVYGILFGVNALGLMASGLVAARLATRVRVRSTVTAAVLWLLFVSAVFAGCAVFGAPAWTLAVLVFGVTSGVGFVMGNTTSLALAEVRHVSGSGSAWLGGAQFTMGAVVSPLSGIGGGSSAVPLGFVLLGSALLACAALAYTSDRFHTRPGRAAAP